MVLQMVCEQSDAYEVSPVNQDALWKKVIADLFEDFLLFFLPDFHEEVDLSTPVEFLQQELFKEIIEARRGRKMADQIAKVQLKNGEEQWVLVHTEVQTEDDKHFPRRMFEYYYRIFDRYDKKIVAIALFTKQSKKSTNQYNYMYFGTELSYTFTKYVLTDFDEEALKASPKLFSKALLASNYMNHTNKKMSLRSAYKRALLRDVWTLNEASHTEKRALLYFVDYLLKLPKEMSMRLTQEMRAEIRKEDTEMLQSHKEDLPPTLAGILDLERQEGFNLGMERGIRQMIERLIENEFSDDSIAHITKQPIEQVQAIRSGMDLK